MGNPEVDAAMEELEKMSDTELLNWVIARGCSFSPGIITYYNNKNKRMIHTFNSVHGAHRELVKIISRERNPKKKMSGWQRHVK